MAFQQLSITIPTDLQQFPATRRIAQILSFRVLRRGRGAATDSYVAVVRPPTLFCSAAPKFVLTVFAFALALAIAPITWASSDPATEDETEPSPEKASQPKDKKVEPIVFDIDDPPRTRYRLVPFWTYGANATLEFDLEKNFDLNDATHDDLSILEPKLGLAFSYDPVEYFNAFLNFSLTKKFTLIEEGKRRKRLTTFRVRRAYLTFKEIADGLSLRIGRQRFDDDREWLYDENLDGIRAFYRYSKFGIEASVSREKLVRGIFLDEERINNYFLYGRYVLARKSEVAAYALYRDNRNDRSSEVGRPIFLGLRSIGEAFDDLDYWIDFAHVRGRGEFDKMKMTSDDIRGFGFDIGGTYASDLPFEPSMTLGYAFGTGDSEPWDNVDHSFRQTGLQDNTDKFNGVTSFKYYGELFDPELSNMHIFTLGIGFRPSQRSSIDFVYHLYRQAAISDEIRDAAIDLDPNEDEMQRRRAWLGSEIDLIFGYRETNSVSIELVLAYFFPGSALRREVNDAFEDADDAFLAGLELRYSF